MICEPGKDWYPLPKTFFALYDTPLLETEPRDVVGYSIRLLQLSPEEMFQAHKANPQGPESWAAPRYFAIIGDKFWLHPAPDKAYVVLTRYHVHPKVW
jgi:hypothetical protein